MPCTKRPPARTGSGLPTSPQRSTRVRRKATARANTGVETTRGIGLTEYSSGMEIILAQQGASAETLLSQRLCHTILLWCRAQTKAKLLKQYVRLASSSVAAGTCSCSCSTYCPMDTSNPEQEQPQTTKRASKPDTVLPKFQCYIRRGTLTWIDKKPPIQSQIPPAGQNHSGFFSAIPTAIRTNNRYMETFQQGLLNSSTTKKHQPSK